MLRFVARWDSVVTLREQFRMVQRSIAKPVNTGPILCLLQPTPTVSTTTQLLTEKVITNPNPNV